MSRNRRRQLLAGEFRLRVYLATFGIVAALVTIVVMVRVMFRG